MSEERHTVKKGLVIVNTGDGKGKTTAALGILMRAWGRGMNIGAIQFFKHNTASFGEHRRKRSTDGRLPSKKSPAISTTSS